MVLTQRVQHIHKDLEFSKDDVKYSIVHEFIVKYLQRNLTFEIYIVCKLTIYCKLIFKAFKVTTLEGCKACAGKHATLVFELSRQRFLQTNAQKKLFCAIVRPTSNMAVTTVKPSIHGNKVLSSYRAAS